MKESSRFIFDDFKHLNGFLWSQRQNVPSTLLVKSTGSCEVFVIEKHFGPKFVKCTRQMGTWLTPFSTFNCLYVGSLAC